MSSSANKERGNAAKNWCFTWHASSVEPEVTIDVEHEPTITEIRDWMVESMNDWDIEFGFAGWEKAPTTGGWHFQGYVSLHKKQRMSFLKKFHKTVSWRIANGDWESNLEYCTKGKDDPEYFYWQSGDLPEFKNNGEREKKRWKAARDAAKEGNFEAVDDQIYVTHYGNVQRIARDHQQKPTALADYNNEWIWGTTGSGKSTRAHEENPDHYHKLLNKWWCGYKQGQTVLIEDIDPDSAKYMANFLKIWLDKFPFTSEAKGGGGPLRPPKIVITSQYQIEECFNARDAAAIRRRCKVRHFENFQEVADTPPNGEAPIGTVGTFVVPATPTTLQAPLTTVPETPATQPLNEEEEDVATIDLTGEE